MYVGHQVEVKDKTGPKLVRTTPRFYDALKVFLNRSSSRNPSGSIENLRQRPDDDARAIASWPLVLLRSRWSMAWSIEAIHRVFLAYTSRNSSRRTHSLSLCPWQSISTSWGIRAVLPDPSCLLGRLPMRPNLHLV